MNERERSHPEDGREAATSRARKPYSSPELIEWGNILEITQGTKSGFKDFPLKGGSTGV